MNEYPKTRLLIFKGCKCTLDIKRLIESMELTLTKEDCEHGTYYYLKENHEEKEEL